MWPLSLPVSVHCAMNSGCDRLAITRRDDDRQRHRDQRDEGEQRRDPQHHAQHADDGQQRREQLAEGLLHRLLDVVDVVGDAAEQLAAGHLVEVAERQPVQLVLDVAAQAQHGALHDAVEDVGLQPHDQGRRDVQDEHQDQHAARGRRSRRPARAPRSCRTAGRRAGPDPRPAAPAIGLVLRDAGGQLLADDALEDDVGGVAQDLRADDAQRDADDRHEQHRDDDPRARGAAGARAAWPTARSPCDFSAGMPSTPIMPPPPGPSRPRGPSGRRDRCLRAHAATSHELLRLHDLGVGRARHEQLLVRADAHEPAVVEHDDLVGVDDARDPLRDDDHGRLAGDRAQRCPQPRVGGEVERGERVVEQVDLRSADDRAGDREPLALAAGEVGAALGDRRCRGPRAARARSRRPARCAAPPRARPRWRRACRTRGCCARCR